MKRFILLFSIIALAVPAFAQDVVTPVPSTICDELGKKEPGKGMVEVYQDPAIRNMVGKRLSGDNIEKDKDNDQMFLKMQGFRVQVFTGNNQRKSKDRVTRAEKDIREIYPDLPAYVTYTAPFWRLRVGDFRSREEAYSLMRELREAFPEFAKEMYIVKDEVKIPL